ncbi:MAG: hypothetical protein NTX50_22855 [Candidatus Sumerlaeota bacterium]|nr:hypothetical protein [Candidatus Sumerlaeota bacterium]
MDFMMKYHRNFYNPSPDAALLGLMSVKYIYSELPVSSPHFGMPPAMQIPSMAGTNSLYANTLALPEVVCEEALKKVIDLKQLDGLWQTTAGQARSGRNTKAPDMNYIAQDFRHTDKMGEIKEAFQQMSKEIKVTRPDCNRINAHYEQEAFDNPEPALLLQTPYPGWVVNDTGDEGRDGKISNALPLEPISAIASRIDLTYCHVCFQQIDLVFRPWSFRLGLFISLLSWACLFCISATQKPCAKAKGVCPGDGRRNGE